MNAQIQHLVAEFETKIMAAARAQVHEEILAKLGTAGMAAYSGAHATVKALQKTRKKGPIQLCPAPGCKERSAPVFSMMCKKHKDTPKTTVAKWREARRKKNGN